MANEDRIATRPMPQPDSFIGDKSYDWVEPEDILGGEYKAVPAGARAFIKKFRPPADAEESWINVFRVTRPPGSLKARNAFVEKISADTPPDESFLKHRYGPGEYVLSLEWRIGDKEKGLRTHPIVIDEWDGRPQPQLPVVGSAPVTPAPVMNPTDMEANMWDRIERMMSLFGRMQPQQTPSASAIVEEAQKTANRILEDASKQAAAMHKELTMMTMQALRVDEEEEEVSEDLEVREESPIPDFLKPYYPLIEGAFKRLLSGNAGETSLVKSMITTSDEFQAVLADENAVNALKQSLASKHGEEKVKQAWDILNSPSEASAAAKAAGGVARKAMKLTGKITKKLKR